MTLTYELDHNDFLQHQLYVASKTPRIKRQRITNWLTTSGCMLILSFMFYQSGNSLLFYYFLVFGAITLIFYPIYERWHYKNHYSKFITHTYKNRFGQIANITFSESGIETKDITGESRINLTELENVTETGDYFYTRLRIGENMIIPKSKLGDVDIVRNELKQLCGRLKIEFIDDTNWRWK
jgi:hypothetical protein